VREKGDLPPSQERAMNAFEQYLELYEIDHIRLSMEAKVRYLTIYNARKGHPITPENAQKIRNALLRMTGVPYTGLLVLVQEQPVDQLPTLPLKKFKLHGREGRWDR
jgi:hypothetical protein